APTGLTVTGVAGAWTGLARRHPAGRAAATISRAGASTRCRTLGASDGAGELGGGGQVRREGLLTLGIRLGQRGLCLEEIAEGYGPLAVLVERVPDLLAGCRLRCLRGAHLGLRALQAPVLRADVHQHPVPRLVQADLRLCYGL